MAHDSFLTTQRRVDIPEPTRQRIEYLTNQVNTLADQRLKANPQDKDALFAKGYSKGLHAAFITLAGPFLLYGGSSGPLRAQRL